LKEIKGKLTRNQKTNENTKNNKEINVTKQTKTKNKTKKEKIHFIYVKGKMPQRLDNAMF
jgi:hypothetical protein